MSQRTFYIRLADAGDSADWLSHAADGTTTRGTCGLVDLQTMALGAKLILLVPVTDVVLAKAVLPQVKRAQQRQAALYALEDQLIDDVSELHAALSERSEDGTIQLAIVSRARIEGWLDLLSQHHLRPELVTVDLLMLPLNSDEWSILWEDSTISIRTGIRSGMGFGVDMWSELWPRFTTEAGEELPKRIRIFDARSSSDVPLQAGDLLPDVEIEIVTDASQLRWLNITRQNDTPLNLLQGDYDRREQWGRILRPWRPAAALLLVWILIQGGMAVADMRALYKQDKKLDEQMVDLYRKSFPDARKVVDPRQQMEQKLTALKNSDGGFLKLSAKAVSALKNVTIKGMRYQDGALDIDVSLQNMAALDAIRASLEAKGLQVDIGNASQQDGKVDGRLTLHGGDA